MAALFSSCEDIPEELAVEVEIPDYMDYFDDSYNPWESIDYVLLTLYKVNNSGGQGANDFGPPIFQDFRLNKGDVLRLEDVEPGIYSLSGVAYAISGEDGYSIPGYIYGKSNKMNGSESFIVEEGVPTVVKLVFVVGT